jgi:hypothetical protein
VVEAGDAASQVAAASDTMQAAGHPRRLARRRRCATSHWISFMRVLFFFAALGFAIVGMSGVTLSLLNLIDESQTGGWPLWQSLIMTAVGVAGFLFCLIKVIRGVREETPPAPPKQVD